MSSGLLNIDTVIIMNVVCVCAALIIIHDRVSCTEGGGLMYIS